MPIHLPPISRRRFLAGSLAATAGLMLPRNIFAAEKTVDENGWVLFSDIHISADATLVHNDVKMTDNFRSAAREVIESSKTPAGLIINGDCAFNAGEVADYEALTGLVKSLREAQIPVYLTLGNHDERSHFRKTLAWETKTNQLVADHQVTLIETPRANWLILDSLEKLLSTPGLIGSGQLDWLASTLDAHPDKPALVMVHHNTTLIKGPVGLKDSDALMAVIRPRKQVKVLFCGHTHDWQHVTDESGIELINLPPTAYVFTKGRPNGWVHATLQPDSLHLQLRCLDITHPQHGQVIDLKYRA